MFKKTALVAGLGLALSATAHAEYDAEINVDVSGGDFEGFGLGAMYYLDSVDDSKGPLGEAAFLDKASSIGVTYSELEEDITGSDLEVETASVGGRYVTDEAGWIFDAFYTNVDGDVEESDEFGVGFGKYLTDQTTLVVGYSNIDPDNSDDLDVYSIDVEHLFMLSEDAIKARAGYENVDTDSDDIDIFNVGATWYPCNSLGIGVDYSNEDDGDTDVDFFTVSAEWFITEQIAANLSYSEADEGDVDADMYMIGISARF